MDRREFIAASLGFLGCSVMKAQGSDEKPLVLLPKLVVSQGGDWRKHGCEPGTFLLAQDETETYLPLGKEVEIEILSYRERVVIYGKEGEKYEIFSCYDPKDPIFIDIKGKTFGKTRTHDYTDEDGRLRGWQIESTFRVAGHEARMGHARKTGMAFVLNAPIGSKVKYDIKDAGYGRYFRRLATINGKGVVHDPLGIMI